jgi:quercetin dioxygenase-like cupin family protein
MKVDHISQVPAQEMDMPGAEKVKIQWLVGERDNPPNFYMRRFEVEAGGCSPKHSHDYEHEVYVLDGEGLVWSENGEKSLGPGSVVLVRPGEEHQFRNTGEGPLCFLCMVPKDAK